MEHGGHLAELGHGRCVVRLSEDGAHDGRHGVAGASGNLVLRAVPGGRHEPPEPPPGLLASS
jgi:hypothetical protein